MYDEDDKETDHEEEEEEQEKEEEEEEGDNTDDNQNEDRGGRIHKNAKDPDDAATANFRGRRRRSPMAVDSDGRR